MKTISLTLGEGRRARCYNVFIRPGEYTNGGTALELVCEDGESFCMLSVWLEATPLLPPGQFYVKHWGQEQTVRELLAKGVMSPTDAPVCGSGFVDEIKAYTLTPEGAQLVFDDTKEEMSPGEKLASSALDKIVFGKTRDSKE